MARAAQRELAGHWDCRSPLLFYVSGLLKAQISASLFFYAHSFICIRTKIY
jgi:hypothetical protein